EPTSQEPWRKPGFLHVHAEPATWLEADEKGPIASWRRRPQRLRVHHVGGFSNETNRIFGWRPGGQLPRQVPGRGKGHERLWRWPVVAMGNRQWPPRWSKGRTHHDAHANDEKRLRQDRRWRDRQAAHGGRGDRPRCVRGQDLSA